jgi:hypothetical protein
MTGDYINFAGAPEMEIAFNDLKALSREVISSYLLGFCAFLAVISAEIPISKFFRIIPQSRIYLNFLLS